MSAAVLGPEPAASGQGLAAPLTLPCGVTLRNRLAKAALSEQLAEPDGSPGPDLVTLYRRWARCGAGLLVTGHVIIDRNGRGEPGNVVLQDDRALERFAAWATAAREGGAEVWMQLNHAGRQSPRSLCPRPVSPSAVPMRVGGGLYASPRALAEEEIWGLIDRFAVAAGLAKAAGFTGVAIHGAHGYLITQFLSPLTNLRADQWGGNPANRRRFVLAVIAAVRTAVGPAFPVAVKLNSSDFQRGGIDPAEAMAVVADVAAAGVDLVEISGGSLESLANFGFDRGLGVGARPEQALAPRTAGREAYFQDFAGAARQQVRTPIMLTGGFRSAAAMEQAVAEGATDVVGLGRPLITEPDLPMRLLADATSCAQPEPRLSIGVPAFDGAAALAWYTGQLRLQARGQQPDLALGPLRALLSAVGALGLEAFRPQRG